MRKLIFFTSVLCISTTTALAANTMNTKTNNMNSAAKKTADSQMKGTDSEVEITRKIRERLTDMEGLSTRAQNVTIVTVGQNVTLKGEVDKQEEIQKIMNVAQEEASGKKITNQLNVHK